MSFSVSFAQLLPACRWMDAASNCGVQRTNQLGTEKAEKAEKVQAGVHRELKNTSNGSRLA
jgi:hypothetical protein